MHHLCVQVDGQLARISRAPKVSAEMVVDVGSTNTPCVNVLHSETLRKRLAEHSQCNVRGGFVCLDGK